MLERRPRWSVLTLLLLCQVLAMGPAGAEAQPTRPADIVIDTVVPPGAQPGPSGMLDPETATAAYLGLIPPEQRTRSDAYFEGGYWIGLWDTVLTAAVMLTLLATGLSSRLRSRIERMTRGPNRQTALYAIAFVAITTLLFLPWSAYVGFFRERQYDLMNQTFGGWLSDWFKGGAIGLVFSTVAITGFYAILRRVPRTWPLWGAAAGVGFLAFTSLIYPVYVAPVFNTYAPVTDERVRDPVLQMARANGLAAGDVYVFDQSRQTKRISANVSGLFHTMRISLNDNLLERTSLPEIKAVMGHEIGHYVLNHVYEGLMAMLILLVGGFLLMRWAFERAAARWSDRWRIRGIHDVAGMPLLLLIFTVVTYVGGPAIRGIVRSNEAEADAFGLNTAREPDGFARVALRLSEYRKLDPHPIEEVLFYTHPSGRDRVYRAMVWKAAELDRATLENDLGQTESLGNLDDVGAP
jgi:STE24 endopeptidase